MDTYNITCKPKITPMNIYFGGLISPEAKASTSQYRTVILKDSNREVGFTIDANWLNERGISSTEAYTFTIMPGFSTEDGSYITDSIIAIHKKDKQIYKIDKKDLHKFRTCSIEQSLKE